jgi:hypothetical protein
MRALIWQAMVGHCAWTWGKGRGRPRLGAVMQSPTLSLRKTRTPHAQLARAGLARLAQAPVESGPTPLQAALP